MTGPVVGPTDAAEICGEVYLNRQDAVAVARWLRSAGWIVTLLDVPSEPRADGTRVVATVFDPETCELVGEVVLDDGSM